MLQLTLRCSYSCFTQPHVPRLLNRLHAPDRLEAALVFIKESKKRHCYSGSRLTHYNDRIFMYGGTGGPKGTKFIVEKHHHRYQYTHPGDRNDRYSIRTVRTRGSQFDQFGGYTRMSWDCSICSTNVLQDAGLRKFFSNIPKQEAINRVEEWGASYVLLDEIRKPSVMDSKYHRHQLYPLKFYWSPDPATNDRIGDADWKWKGDELISYADYNAISKDIKNRFRSVWKLANGEGIHEEGVAAASSTSSEKQVCATA